MVLGAVVALGFTKQVVAEQLTLSFLSMRKQPNPEP